MTRQRVLVVVIVLVAAGLFVVSGGWSFVRDGDRVEAFFTERGALGPVVFVAAMWAIQPAGMPGAVFMIPAAVVWPLPVAMGLSWIGNMGASTIAFAMARWLARDWAQDHLPDRLRGFDARLARGSVRDVTALRVVTGQFTPADWLLGVSTVRFGVFLVGTGLGIIPGIVLATTLGGGLVSLISDPQFRLPVIGALVGFAVVRRVRRHRRRGLGTPTV